MLLIAFLFIKLFCPELATTVRGRFNFFECEYNPEWKCTQNEEGIALYERWVKINDTLNVRERRGEMVVDCNFAQAVKYLGQYQNMKEWMSSVSLMERIPDDKNQGTLVYLVFGLPWPFENRDVTGRFKVFQLNDKNCVVRMDSEPNVKPARKDRVRINNYQASWNLIKLDEKRTKLVLYTFSDTPPLAPLWVQDPIVRKVFHSNLLKLKNKLAGFN